MNARGIRRSGLPGRPIGSRVVASQAEGGRQVGRTQSPRRWACGASQGTGGWPERHRPHGQAPPDLRPMVARVRRVPRRALHFDRAWRLGSNLVSPCSGGAGPITPASPLAQPAYHVKYGRATGAEWVGALHPGGVLRPGVGAASPSERGPFRTPGWLRVSSPPARFHPRHARGRWMELPRHGRPLRHLRHRARRSRQPLPARGDGGRAEVTTGGQRPSEPIETASGRWSVQGIERRHEARGVRAGGGRCECLRQSCAAHYAGRCGRLLTAGWHAHPLGRLVARDAERLAREQSPESIRPHPLDDESPPTGPVRPSRPPRASAAQGRSSSLSSTSRSSPQ